MSNEELIVYVEPLKSYRDELLLVILKSIDVENAEKSVEPERTPSPPANNIVDSEPLTPAIHLSVVEFHNNEPDDNVPVASFV